MDFFKRFFRVYTHFIESPWECQDVFSQNSMTNLTKIQFLEINHVLICNVISEQIASNEIMSEWGGKKKEVVKRRG